MAKDKDDKAKAAAPAAARKEEPAAAAVKKKGGKTLIIVAAASAVVLLGGGGAAWYFLRAAHASTADAAGKAGAKHAEKPKPGVFVPLETFTVNLQAENGERFLQTTLTLKVADDEVEQSLKQQMPEIRSRLLLLLSSKSPSELTSVDGKQTLANQIAGEVNAVLVPGAAKPDPAHPAPPKPGGPVLSVLFTNFIIQ